MAKMGAVSYIGDIILSVAGMVSYPHPLNYVVNHLSNRLLYFRKAMDDEAS